MAALAFAVYAPTVRNGFAHDDVYAVRDNPVVRGSVPLAEAFRRDSWGGGGTRTYRPLQLLLLRAEWNVFGERPSVMHAVNALLHAAAAAALYLVFRRLVAERAAIGAAGLFAVFAAPSEAVEAIVGVADILVTLFSLAGLAAHRRRGAAGAALAAGALAAAFCSKETALFAPLAWLLADLIVPEGRLRERAGRFGLYAIVTAAWLGARHAAFGTLAPPATDPFFNPLSAASLAGRTFGAGRLFAERYLAGLADPFRRLYMCTAPDCGPSTAGDAIAWLGLLAAAALVVACVALRRANAGASAGLAWLLAFFLPVSNLLFLSSTPYAERLLYAPAVGLCVALACGADALARRIRPAIAFGGLAALAALNAGAVLHRNGDWRSSDDLYLSAADLAPRSAGLQCHAAHAAHVRGDRAMAEQRALLALELWPKLANCLALLGRIREEQRNLDEADRLFTEAVRSAREPAIFVLTAAYLARTGRAAQGVELLELALRRYPGRVIVAEELARLRSLGR